MIELSDHQIEMVRETVEALAEEKRHAFLVRVAAVLQGRRQLNDDHVSTAVRFALRDLIHNSAVWREWRRASLASQEDEQERVAPPSRPRNRSHNAGQQRQLKQSNSTLEDGQSVAPRPHHRWRLLPAWLSNLRPKLPPRRQPANFHRIVRS
jgi:hypothetical protein